MLNDDYMAIPFPSCAICGEQNVEDAGDHADKTGHWPRTTKPGAPPASNADAFVWSPKSWPVK